MIDAELLRLLTNRGWMVKFYQYKYTGNVICELWNAEMGLNVSAVAQEPGQAFRLAVIDMPHKAK